ncbi:MAG: tol-pal system protein YbgF [Hyphomicrobiaceae bacterium]|nr:tol-pal system protein YbgF [Hyphomicrobiaceae bacterium]
MTCWDRYLLGLAGAVLLPAVHAYAQQQTPSATRAAGPQVAEAGPVQRLAQSRQPAAAASKGAGEASADASRGGDPLLRQRVEQLEEQFLDMQVVVGTLESLARNAGAATPSMRSAPVGLGSGSDAARIDALETQVRALTAQLEQLTGQLRSRGGGLPTSVQREPLPPAAAAPVTLAPAPETGFGATVVTPGGGDPIGRIISEGASSGASSQLALAPPGNGGDPKQAYEAAYGYLLQQNYGAAESAFEDFLRRYPEDALAGNAQYWLGESLFVRGQYKAAASAFLKGYQTYGRSAKAPDSLLKLAMSLDRLGQKDAACSSFAELSSRFPTAPSHVKTRAQTERQRVGC